MEKRRDDIFLFLFFNGSSFDLLVFLVLLTFSPCLQLLFQFQGSFIGSGHGTFDTFQEAERNIFR